MPTDTSSLASVGKGLQGSAIGVVSSATIGLASTGPAYSLAVTLGTVVAATGVRAPVVMFLALIPNLCIAVACQQLNRRSPDCGSSFAWTLRAFGARTAWMTGWAMLMTDVIVMATFASVVARYGLLLFGDEGRAGDSRWVATLGVSWVAFLTWLSLRKIQVSARAQCLWVGLEAALLVAFAVVALLRVRGGSAPAAAHLPEWRWLDATALDPGSFSKGMLAALFMYWGWDTSFAINEESRRPDRDPAWASALCTGLLVALYVLVTTAAVSFSGVGMGGLLDVDPSRTDDVFATLAGHVFGDGWLSRALVLAVLTSALASAQTTILPAARLILSMSAYRALPRSLGAVDPARFTPTVATVTVGAVSTIVFLALLATGREILDSSINAITVLIAFYYAMTGFACAWTFRAELSSDAASLLTKGVIPLFGAATLSVALVASFAGLFDRQANATLLWGIGCPLAIGLVAIAVGVVAMIACNVAAPDYFRRR